LLGDSENEVIMTSYLDGGAIEHLNAYQILRLNKQTGLFEIIYRTNNPNAFYPSVEITPSEDMGGNYTRILDINNDNINDIIISREGVDSPEIRSFSIEIWLGDGNDNYIPTDLITNENKFWGVGFRLLDIDIDGDLDIVFMTERDGSIRLASKWEDGFKLNDLIHINNGDGTFDKYSGSDLIGGIGTTFEKFIPYMRDGSLTFIGTFTELDNYSGEYVDSIIYEATLNNIF